MASDRVSLWDLAMGTLLAGLVGVFWTLVGLLSTDATLVQAVVAGAVTTGVLAGMYVGYVRAGRDRQEPVTHTDDE